MAMFRFSTTVMFRTLVVASLLFKASAQSAAPPPQHEPALDVTSMDRSVDPCVDFFKYSCGGWMKNNPIPPDQSSWDTYSKMQDENLGRLRGILEAASAPDSKRNPATQKIGDYYSSCTDEKTIEKKGAEPLKPALDRIAKITSKAEIADVTAAMIDSGVLFRFGSIQDFKDANQMIAQADQDGWACRIAITTPKMMPSQPSCAKLMSNTCRRCFNCSAISLT